ncbi:MAG: AIPR family protein [Bacillota bacterium]|nr:AIPR family protein [Bacillota bacterium]
MLLDERIEELYNKYKDIKLKKNIVRLNQPNDAFVLLVAETVFGQHNRNNNLKIFDYIIPPPDEGIDIFFEEEDDDEYIYHIVQVKNQKLSQSKISNCFASMQRTMRSYEKNTRSISNNLKEVISKTNFATSRDSKCIYYVVHRGDLNCIKAQREDEKIISENDLITLQDSIPFKCIPKEEIKVDGFNNIIFYRSKKGKLEDNGNQPKAYLCNLNGYDLAELNNKYSSTEVGKNLLYKLNFRDSLGKKSKTFDDMFRTIDTMPENFWFFNNGITIIAEEFILGEEEKNVVCLKRFSIINGAQSTSTLGLYLKDARLNNDFEKIEELKQVYVLARIVEIKDDDKLRNDIAIYNNCQNPISSRDMVSNREEQIRLNQWLQDSEEPRIFVEIRRGETPKSGRKLYNHQKTNNELLAQLAFSSFLSSPYKAKSKKKTLFNNTSQDIYTLNEDYNSIFNYNKDNLLENGILFNKSKEDINELLFVAKLYKEARSYLKKDYTEKIENFGKRNENLESIKLLKRQLEINNVCLFYNITLYYEFKTYFDSSLKAEKKIFRYDEYYNRKNKEFKKNLIRKYASMFLEETIEIIRDESGEANISNWIKTQNSENIFLKKLRGTLSLKTEYKFQYQEFIDTFKK